MSREIGRFKITEGLDIVVSELDSGWIDIRKYVRKRGIFTRVGVNLPREKVKDLIKVLREVV